MEAMAVIFIGRRHAPFYLAKTVTELSARDVVKLVARGQFIAKAVSVAVRVIKVSGCEYHVVIDEEEVSSDSGTRFVPKIEIELVKKAAGPKDADSAA